ncbi:MAG: hypothetical protein GY822_08930 [Deltaproteobacteria bacterium]|nr:hypothetical protein [Deltaproteobacteria bacterium]
MAKRPGYGWGQEGASLAEGTEAPVEGIGAREEQKRRSAGAEGKVGVVKGAGRRLSYSRRCDCIKPGSQVTTAVNKQSMHTQSLLIYLN